MLQKLIKSSPIYKFQVSGNSMYPTLKPGDTVLVSRLFKLKVGDIIAIKDPRDGKALIKRISKIDSAKQNLKYFVLGDNEKESTDSRKFGMLERQDIIGKVIYLDK